MQIFARNQASNNSRFHTAEECLKTPESHRFYKEKNVRLLLYKIDLDHHFGVGQSFHKISESVAWSLFLSNHY